MKITRIGLDLAKNGFQVPGVDRQEGKVLSRQLRRAQMLTLFSDLPASHIDMDAPLPATGREARDF